MNRRPSTAQPPNILVVDDTPANLQLLTAMLKDRGYKVRPAPSGELALRAAQSSPPDLILLDITMPGMDGFEVCSRLKANEALRDIPVLFISALNETADKVRAFQAGGVDYVTKPFQFEEIEARVRAHLELRRKTLELEHSYGQLRKFEQLRDNLTHMIAHDMRSPLLSLGLAIDMFRESETAPNAADAELLLLARRSVAMLVEMIAQMLDVSRLEAGQMQLNRTLADLVPVVRESIDLSLLHATDRRPLLDAPADPVPSFFDPNIVRRVIGNLLGNALKFSPTGGRVGVRISREAGAARVEVSDNGPGIAPEHHQRIFEKFGQLETGQKRSGSGLGLTFAKMAVEAHGGQIGVRSALGQGSVFWFTLPAGAPEAGAEQRAP
jgi:two-component system sensor histidine kinase/response regulator